MPPMASTMTNSPAITAGTCLPIMHLITCCFGCAGGASSAQQAFYPAPWTLFEILKFKPSWSLTQHQDYSPPCCLISYTKALLMPLLLPYPTGTLYLVAKNNPSTLETLCSALLPGFAHNVLSVVPLDILAQSPLSLPFPSSSPGTKCQAAGKMH